MYEELNISELEGVWAAYLAICDLKEETERLQAACAAKTAELAELREQTAELFAERVAAEGADDDAVHAAMAMWQHDPESAARAVLGCDIAEAANPYGCNQYGHEWRGKHGEGWKPSGRGGKEKPGEKSDSSETLTKEMRRKHEEYEKAQEAYRQARKKVFDLDDEIENAIKNGDSEKADQLEKEQEEARRMWREASSNADRVTKEYRELSKRYRAASNKGEKTVEEEADEYENSSEKERGLKLFIWKRDLQQAKDKALDIRESTKYRQRDPETVKQYEEAKKEANERAKRLRATLKAIGERRGWDKKKIDYMLRRYPETVIDF
ncbi:MAG: hypothetical protein IJZ39_12430 [Oscillospiraceae bacterium]|nr:hypothetical protein [Oscillospiraceae bacterium]